MTIRSPGAHAATIAAEIVCTTPGALTSQGRGTAHPWRRASHPIAASKYDSGSRV